MELGIDWHPRCSRCDNPPAPGSKYCRECSSAYMREWRKTHPLSGEERRKDITRSYTHVLIKRGKLIRQPCRECGAEPAQAHHPDYSDPRTVIWLCPTHHRALHRSLA